MTLDYEAIKAWTEANLRARRAYQPDVIQASPDCSAPGCTNPAKNGSGLCRPCRADLADTHPDPVRRLAEG